MRVPIRWRIVLVICTILQVIAGRVVAAEKLSVDLIPLGLLARNEAPVPVVARFKWDSTRILEGRLEMEFREGNRILGRYRSGDLALTGGEQKFQMLLPPSLVPFSDSQMEVQMKFVSAGNAIQIEPSILSVPTAGERSLVVGWCDAGTASGQSAADLVQNLRLEHFAPTPDNAAQRLLMTSVVRLTPEDLPVQPLAYATFDVVVLTAEAFKATSERQFQALARWVKGGGSVCVFIGGGLQPRHAWFLNQLDESITGDPVFQTDNAGNLPSAGGGILHLRSGVGRSVIVAGANLANAGLNMADWRAAVAFLWKMRSSQARATADSGHWKPPVNLPMDYNSAIRAGQFPRNGPRYAEPLSYSVQPSNLGAELLNLLMPRTVRLIPFSALMGMLILFVLLIGPADYFVLGFLRRRRLTWLLFPAMSIAFTVVTVLMANHYLGLRDQRRSLFVVDLDKAGNALRWNQYELVFAARDKQSVTELKDALWAPLKAGAVMNQPYVQVIRGRQVFVVPNSQYNPGYSPNGGAAGETEPPVYDGTLPVRFQASKTLRQWRPELNRIFSFEPPPVPLFPNWRAVEKAWPNLQTMRAELSGKSSFSGDLYAVSSSRSTTADARSGEILPASILGELCASDSSGLQSLVSQMSPTGGGNFEDVPAMDMEANDSALAIVTRVGDDIVIYRRFYYGN